MTIRASFRKYYPSTYENLYTSHRRPEYTPKIELINTVTMTSIYKVFMKFYKKRNMRIWTLFRSYCPNTYNLYTAHRRPAYSLEKF